jgi:hypothetical protein
MEVGRRGGDDTKRELSEKVARAVEYYTAKYGVAPTLCFVNPNRLKQVELRGSVQVRPAGPALANPFWGAVDEAPAPADRVAAPRRKKMDVQS